MQLTKKLRQADIEPHMPALYGWLRGNIVGMYAGRKRKNGKKTDQYAIVLHVQKKKSPDRLAMDGDELIPPFVELPIAQNGVAPVMVQVPTDIQEVGPLDAAPLPKEPEPMASWERIRPAPGGQYIQPLGLNVRGTLGCTIGINGAYRMLSCNHVMSWNGQFSQIYQPDTTVPQNFLTTVSGYTNIIGYPTSNQQNPYYNMYDVAWCNTTLQQCDTAINEIGTPVGFGAATNNMQIWCYGAATDAVMQGEIESIEYAFVTRMFGNQYAWFKNAMFIGGAFLPLPGDSGSVLVNAQKQIVGMLMSTNIFGAQACIIPTNIIQ